MNHPQRSGERGHLASGNADVSAGHRQFADAVPVPVGSPIDPIGTPASLTHGASIAPRAYQAHPTVVPVPSHWEALNHRAPRATVPGGQHRRSQHANWPPR